VRPPVPFRGPRAAAVLDGPRKGLREPLLAALSPPCLAGIGRPSPGHPGLLPAPLRRAEMLHALNRRALKRSAPEPSRCHASSLIIGGGREGKGGDSGERERPGAGLVRREVAGPHPEKTLVCAGGVLCSDADNFGGIHGYAPSANRLAILYTNSRVP
jgi:hypothetical protein